MSSPWTTVKGVRRRSEGAGGRRGLGGVSMEASSGAGQEDEDEGRVWNKCTDRVELGTSGLMVSRVRKSGGGEGCGVLLCQFGRIIVECCRSLW